MTPRTIDSEIMETLLKDSASFVENFHLTDEQPVISLLPPLVLRARLNFKASPQTPLNEYKHTEFHTEFYSSPEEARKAHPLVPVYPGHPHRVADFLSEVVTETSLDFGFGVAFFSRKHLEHKTQANELFVHELSAWLNYALSPELWGPEGKWTRFHNRLMTLCEKNKILNGECKIGLYPLKSGAREWKKIQLEGNLVNETLILTLPWTFSLTALETLENLIGEEP